MCERNKPVFLYGVHSVNLGDDLFFNAILERYPTTQFYVYAPDVYKQILAPYSNCKVLSDSDKALVPLARFCKMLHLPKFWIILIYIILKNNIQVFLIAGGSLFMEGKSNLPQLVRRLNLIRFFHRRLQIVINGTNYGPSVTDSWQHTVANTLQKVDDVCFRDKPSFELFRHLPNVRYANDIVMHMDLSGTIQKNKSISINIRSVDKWPSLKPLKQQYLENTKSIIEHYQQKGFAVNLVSFCNTYGDNQITDELFQMLDNTEYVHILNYTGNISECLAAISSSEFILATRFHAIVLGLVFGLRVLPISYSIKSENMLRSMNIWSPIYDYAAFCAAPVEMLLNSTIDNFVIDKTVNNQFDYLDKILIK